MDDIENLLENIRLNCVVLNKEHKKRYIKLKNTLKWFRIPIIVLSGMNSLLSVSLQNYLEQGIISISTALVSLTCGIIGSVELYLSIQQNMEMELITSKDYYLLGVDIFKILSLKEKNRNVELKAFLDDKFQIYQKLVENSNILEKKVLDKLCPIFEPNTTPRLPSSPSSTTTQGEISSLSSNEVNL
jgi:hypothetical protein